MRHGYFIPSQNELFGDLPFATEARDIWTEIALGWKYGCDHPGCKEGVLCKDRYYQSAEHYDGVSIHQASDDAPIHRVVTLRDFFSPAFKVLVKEYPFT
jgi:hypothetical protein